MYTYKHFCSFLKTKNKQTNTDCVLVVALVVRVLHSSVLLTYCVDYYCVLFVHLHRTVCNVENISPV